MVSPSYRIRLCTNGKEDCKHIHRLVTQLAIHENKSRAVKLTPDDYYRDGFETQPPLFYAALAEYKTDNTDDHSNHHCKYEAIGLIVWYFTYSTWTGRTCFIEDLYVERNHRKKGIGLKLLKFCANHAHQMGCKQMEWLVLDWNLKAIEFYKAIGAKPLSEWKLMILLPDAFRNFATMSNCSDFKKDDQT